VIFKQALEKKEMVAKKEKEYGCIKLFINTEIN
jgi:hypothetical protein